MASINSALVRRELRAMANASNVIRKQLEQMFKQLEKDPSRYPELDEVDPRIIIEFPNLVLRKVHLTHRRHNFRIVFAHWHLVDSEHVDLLIAFRRTKGYRIDWDWLAGQLGG